MVRVIDFTFNPFDEAKDHYFDRIIEFDYTRLDYLREVTIKISKVVQT